MISPNDTLNRWLSNFASALSRSDFETILELFWPDAYWRDLLAFTRNIHTAEGRPAIGEMLWARLAETESHGWRADGPAREGNGVIEGNLTFETAVARCQAVVRLRDGRCWMLAT
jgi:putative flavoprotein involved in K+ transport